MSDINLAALDSSSRYQLAEARRLGAEHGSTAQFPYRDVAGAGQAALMHALNAAGEQASWRLTLAAEYATAWAKAAGRPYPAHWSAAVAKDELTEFLATRTILATIDPSAAGRIAARLIEAGWVKGAPSGNDPA
jgi:hypothetical protein